VGQFITITGTGFAAAHDIGIEFGTTLVTTYGQAAAPAPTTATLLDTVGVTVPLPLTLAACTAAAPCIETDANGYFVAILAVPAVVGGAQTVTVSDGTNSGTTSFTVNPSLVVSKTSGFPDQQFNGATVTVTGFPASDTVTITTTALTNVFGTITTGSATQAPAGAAETRTGVTYTNGPGIGQLAGQALVVAETAGGKLPVTATGASTIVASTTFTVNPVIAIFNSQVGNTAYSMLSTGSVLLAGYGFPAGTIAANSITITPSTGGSVTTQSALITVGSSGTFGAGSLAHSVVIPNSTPSQGPASIVITDGSTVSTFNYASHNILATSATDSSTTGGATANPNLLAGASALAAGSVKYGYGAPFIISTAGGISSTAIWSTDASSYKPNTGATVNRVTLFAADYATNDAAMGTPTVTITGGTAVAFGPVPTADANGALWLVNTANIGEEPASSTGYGVLTGIGGVGSVLSPTINIAQYITLGAMSTLSFTTTGTTVTFHGFTAGNGCSLTIGTTAMSVNAGVCAIGPNGATAALSVVSPGLTVVDLPGGAFTATGSDGTVSAVAGGFVLPADTWGGTAITTAFSTVNPAPGTPTILRSSTTFGVHGLAANTAYTVVLDPGQASQTTLGTFTSTAGGQIPAPGVQFTVPATSSGFHFVGLLAGTTNVFWNALATSTNGGTSVSTSANESPSAASPAGSEQLITGNPANTAVDASNNQITSQNGANQFRGQYGDGILAIGAALTASPSAVSVGGTSSSFIMSGTGLAPNQVYDVSILIGAGAPPAACAAGVGTTVVSAFTTSATGTVPAATSVPLTDYPTYDVGGAGSELGTLYCGYVSTPTGFQGGVNSGFATFDVQASMGLNMTTAPIGHAVTATAHGLAANKFYNIIFNPQATITGFISGQIVGGILSNGNGAAAGTFNVPATASPGTFSVQLQTAAQIGLGVISLATPPTVSVTTTAGTCTNQGTTCMSVGSGANAPNEQTVGANKAIIAAFTNNSNAQQTAVIYAVIHNAAGQTVAYTTATISPAAGATATGTLVLFGLAPGTYSATVFVTSTGGVAISSTSTVSVTI